MRAIERILSRLRDPSEWHHLVGMAEASDIEFKSGAYRLADPSQKHELAKDLSALANSGGGILALGVKTTREIDSHRDVVASVSGMRPEHFDEQQLSNVVAAWVFPSLLAHMRIEKVEGPAGRVVVLLIVQASAQLRAPFLVLKSVSQDGRLDRQSFTVYHRSGSDVRSQPAEEIHPILLDGLRFDTHLRRATRFMDRESSARGSASAVPRPQHGRNMDMLFDAARLAEVGHGGVAIFGAFPIQEASLEDEFVSERSEVRKFLRSPEEWRPMGYNWPSDVLPRLDHGRLLHAMIPGYGGMVVDVRGRVSGVFEVVERLSTDEAAKPIIVRLNPLALIESLMLFVASSLRIHRRCLDDRAEVQYEIYLGGLRGVDLQVRMQPFLPGTFGWLKRDHLRESSSDTCHASASSELASVDPGRIAYALTRQVYLNYGLSMDALPFISGEGAGRRFDKERYLEFIARIAGS